MKTDTVYKFLLYTLFALIALSVAAVFIKYIALEEFAYESIPVSEFAPEE